MEETQKTGLHNKMSMSVDIHVYDIKALKEVISKSVNVKEGQVSVSDFLDKAMEEAGIVINGLFIVQSCDYWDYYSPYSSIMTAVEAYYGKEDLYDEFSKAQIAWRYTGVEETDIYRAVDPDMEDYPIHPLDKDEENEDE